MFAEWKGHLLIVKMLVEHGGEVFHKARWMSLSTVWAVLGI